LILATIDDFSDCVPRNARVVLIPLKIKVSAILADLISPGFSMPRTTV
jgi:hypothetical protein